MKPLFRLHRFLSGPAMISAFTVHGAGLDTAMIEKLTGLNGVLNTNEGAFKVSAPRDDVKITVDGWKTPPFMGLTSWAGFIEGRKTEAMVAGDLVLFEDEVNPVVSSGGRRIPTTIRSDTIKGT